MIETTDQCNDPSDLQSRILQRNITKKIYNCKAIAYIHKSMRFELKIIKQVLSNPLQYNLETPIAYLVSRDPDFVTYGDASLEATGGFSNELKFWWHIEWPQSIKSKIIKNLSVTRRCPLSKELVSINLLEFLTEIINFATVSILFQADKHLCKQPYPVLLNWTDKQTSQACIKKAFTKTAKGKALQRILCILMINDPVGFKVDYIEGSKNILADRISRLYSNSATPPSFTSLIQEFPQMKLWNIFLPSPELLSTLYSALLEGREPGLCLPKKLGHFVPGKPTLSSSSMTCNLAITLPYKDSTHHPQYNHGLLHRASRVRVNSSMLYYQDTNNQEVSQGSDRFIYPVPNDKSYPQSLGQTV